MPKLAHSIYSPHDHDGSSGTRKLCHDEGISMKSEGMLRVVVHANEYGIGTRRF